VIDRQEKRGGTIRGNAGQPVDRRVMPMHKPSTYFEEYLKKIQLNHQPSLHFIIQTEVLPHITVLLAAQ